MKIRARFVWNSEKSAFVNNPPRRQGKQEKCACGSNRKFRKCCGIGNREKVA